MKKATQEEYDAAMERLRSRMAQWRTDNPKSRALISFKDVGPSNVVIVCTIRDAILIGMCKVNQDAYNMIKFMCEPEKSEPTVSMIRQLIEPPIDEALGIKAIQYLQHIAGITEPIEKAKEGWARMSYGQQLHTIRVYEYMMSKDTKQTKPKRKKK